MAKEENGSDDYQVGFTLSNEEYLSSMSKFIVKSDKLYDEWEIAEFKDVKYLKLSKQRVIRNNIVAPEKGDVQNITCEQTLHCNSSLGEENSNFGGQANVISLEYHIIYSISYCVPVLYIRGFDSSGSLLRIDQLIKNGLFCNIQQDSEIESDGNKEVLYSSDEHEKKYINLSIPRSFVKPDTFSQVSHPLNFEPFYQLHPCHTSEWMKMMYSVKTENNCPALQLSVENYIIIWLSFVGPFVGISLDNKYMLP